MFKQIFISILAFLLTIFPNSSTLLGNYQELTFPGMHEVSQQIVDAINNNDVEAFKEVLSPNMKKNVPDLDAKIQFLMDSIDKRIDEYEVRDGGGGSTSNYGYYEKTQVWSVLFEYNELTYRIVLRYEIANTKTPDDVGVITVRLMCSDFEHPDMQLNEIITFEFAT